jgi:hypothetical protein
MRQAKHSRSDKTYGSHNNKKKQARTEPRTTRADATPEQKSMRKRKATSRPQPNLSQRTSNNNETTARQRPGCNEISRKHQRSSDTTATKLVSRRASRTETRKQTATHATTRRHEQRSNDQTRTNSNRTAMRLTTYTTQQHKTAYARKPRQYDADTTQPYN